MPKGRIENLVSLADRTSEERRELAKKAGSASGVARRKYRTMRETLKMVLSMDVADEQKAQALKALGIAPTYQNAIQIAMASKAVDGDVDAARFVRDTSGEKPAQAVEMAVTDKPFEALDLKSLSDDDLKTLAEDGSCGTDVVQSATSDG